MKTPLIELKCKTSHSPVLYCVVVFTLIIALASVTLNLFGPEHVLLSDYARNARDTRHNIRTNRWDIGDLKMIPPYKHLQDISVRVDVGLGRGTGVLVTRQVGNVTRTFVWTAGHVAACLERKDGTFKNAIIYHEERVDGLYVDVREVEARIIAYSADEDLALLEILEDNYVPLNTSVRFNLKEIPLVGTELVHVGCVLGLYDSVSLGIMSQTDRDLLKTGKMFDQTSVMGYPGSSGGGVYLLDGKCIGLLTRGAGPGLNFIVPVRRMMEWAEKEGLEWALNPDIPVPLSRALTSLEQAEQSEHLEQLKQGDIDPRTYNEIK